MDFLMKLKHARNAGAPIVCITTADQQACLATVAPALNGDGSPLMLWDCKRGLQAVEGNKAGKALVAQLSPGPIALDALLDMAIEAFPGAVQSGLGGAVLLVKVADGFEIDPLTFQALENLRDEFKRDGRMVVFFTKGLTFKGQLADDVVVIDEPLPDKVALESLVRALDKGAHQVPSSDELIGQVVEAITGLNTFAAETVVSMALRKNGIDVDHCWERKIVTIEQTRGLNVYRGGQKYADLGGIDALKEDVRAVFQGRRKPRLVVWLDEVEKTGLGSLNDSAGVNQDQEGYLLQWLQDHDVYGMMLLGVPGSGKSAFCKAVGAEFGTVVIRLDLGALQAKHVGESQENLRHALKVIEAIGGNNTLWLATSNSIDKLSAAMRSRFVDTYFFDLPTREERKPIWKVWLKKMGLTDEPYEDDEGWVGRNIQQCVNKAWSTGISVAEAAKRIVPVGTVEREDTEALRAQADGRYLSANRPGVYEVPKRAAGAARQVKVR